MRWRVHVPSFLIGAAAAVSALAATPGSARAEDPNAPIAIAVTSSLQGQKGLGRIFSAAGSGEVSETARDVERLLVGARWARMVSREPEVLVTVDSRERIERRRTTDKEGRESIEHRYRAAATVEMGRRRVPVRVEHDFTEGPYSTRQDYEQFRKVAEKLTDEIAGVVLASLNELRPNRPEAGFDHARKYKLLVKGDGLEVKSVEPGSPAERAGLQIKDRIRRIDDEKGTDQMDYRVRTWWVEAPGTRVSVEVERNKQRQTLQLTLQPRGEWAAAGGGSPAVAYPASSAAASAPRSDTARPSGETSRVELKPGMTELQVVRALGPPREKVSFGPKMLWRYDGFSVTFQDGKVVDMK